MPLGYLISVESRYLEDIVSSMKEEGADHIFDGLIDGLKGTLKALDTGRGHMFLQSYLLGDGQLDAALMGEELITEFDDGSFVTFNSFETVKQLSVNLDKVGHSELGILAEAYHEQVPRQENSTSKPKRGLMRRLMNRKAQTVSEPGSANKIDPTLLILFDDLKAFYQASSETEDAVICMVTL